MKLPLLLTLLLASLSARAELIEAQGSAAILGGDEVYAREQATRDALRQALLASGAAVSSVQRLENGSLRSEQIQIRSGGDIRQYRLKREEVRNGRMYITLVADIQAERQICQTQHFAKDLTLVRLRMRYPDQASYGAMDDMPENLSRRLFETLANAPQGVAVRQWLDENLRIDPLHLQQGDRSALEEIKALSLRTDSQYLVLGSIDDLSIEPQGNQLTSWYEDPVRNFRMQLYLFDGINGSLVNRKAYEGRATWTFGKREQVGSSSGQFWQSSYGQEVNYQLQQAAQDLVAQLTCAPVTARVVGQNERGPYINLGRRNGVKLGDQFRIQHNADFIDPYGKSRMMRNPADGLFEVVQVFDDGAIISSQNKYSPFNIQNGDLAVLE
ncbi:TPA: flagellar assembly protein FlgT [Aeromonas veronii]|uniref:flagellar assembly protein FlgT n=1 Tax=Aeromonas TaxID=642 RepID=UPI000DE57E9F|nr:flagellar assembly protein FlgT [Aeromonas veronii]MBL0476975.1 flagella assembly protein FlgT [Aeromonas veronii]